MNHRIERINSLIQEELAKILVREIDFRGALATVTGVATLKKFDYATVGVSVIPSDRSDDVLRTLTKACPHLQYLLMKKMNIKPMPRIRFEIDRGLEKAAEMEGVFASMQIEDEEVKE